MTIRRTRRNGLTLIEVLVVVAVVAILASMLMPALRRARLGAMDASCLSNIRQIYQAHIAYQGDYNHLAFDHMHLPLITRDNTRRPYSCNIWPVALEPYLGITRGYEGAASTNSASRRNSPLYCPDLPETWTDPDDGKVYPLGHLRSPYYGGGTTYPAVMLQYHYEVYTTADSGEGVKYWAQPVTGTVATWRIKEPSRYAMHFEGKGWPNGIINYGSTWPQWAYSWHGGQYPVLFWDGHAVLTETIDGKSPDGTGPATTAGVEWANRKAFVERGM